MLFTSLLITFFLFSFPVAKWVEMLMGKLLHLLLASACHLPTTMFTPLIVPFHTHARSSVLWWWILAVTSNKHSEKLHYHFKGCLSIRGVNTFAPFQWQRLSLPCHVGKENWPPVPNFMWNFFSEIGQWPLLKDPSTCKIIFDLMMDGHLPGCKHLFWIQLRIWGKEEAHVNAFHFCLQLAEMVFSEIQLILKGDGSIIKCRKGANLEFHSRT